MDAQALFGDKRYLKPDLPIYKVSDDLIGALREHNRVVLCAPPGAGKTTAIPLEVLSAGIGRGKVLMLEPRRLAARAAAERMAEMVGEPLGQTIGYRIKGENKVSNTTIIEVVTEGILTKMIQSDPGLEGIGTIIFDEFHERSLHADLGLALCIEISDALRSDLSLIVMSATLEPRAVSELLGNAPVIISEGKRFPVEPIWLDQPRAKSVSFEYGMKELILRALSEKSGGILVFLPGEWEIQTVGSLLKPHLSDECTVHFLYSSMPFHKQREAIFPQQRGRKVVLATSIAETSLTIEDICIVIDGGKARRAEFDIASGMQRLVTTKISKAEAAQRMGRAGRVAAGTCYKYWSRAEEGSLTHSPPAEIDVADLSSLALDLALWGTEVDQLAFLSPPNPARLHDARNLLRILGALRPDGTVTTHGKAIAKLPLHPRLGHLLLSAGKPSAKLAALLNERDPLPRNAPKDFMLRLELLENEERFASRYSFPINVQVLARIKNHAKQLKSAAPMVDGRLTSGQMLALAYPDRIGKRRKAQENRFLLSSGIGAYFAPHDPLSNSAFIVAAELDGQKREAGIRRAISITEAEIRDLYSSNLRHELSCKWSKRDNRVISKKDEKLGSISLESRAWTDVPEDKVALALLEGIREIGLCLSEKDRIFLYRLSAAGEPYSCFTEEFLLDTLEDWLLPYLGRMATAKEWKSFDKSPALQGILNYREKQILKKKVPAIFITPLGREIPIIYRGGQPEISLKLQEMFGQRTHPMVGNKPLLVTLLSPAGKPLQRTTDIPGFWKSSYSDVRKDMRGRYPKHSWPKNPEEEAPTIKAKK